jgi:hypothetical protein
LALTDIVLGSEWFRGLKEYHYEPLRLNRDGDVHGLGRTAGRIFLDISTTGLWYWCLNDRAPPPASDRGYAPTRAKAMLMLKHRWLERAPLRPGEMQMDRPKWMESH